jgi:hypothetical protein
MCAVLVFLVAAAVYGCTLAPTLTWKHDGADGGDLIAAAATLGVPHPSGYPTYVLLARGFLQGLPLAEPAARVHWLSALSGAGAAALLSLSIAESLRAERSSTNEPTAVPRLPFSLSSRPVSAWLIGIGMTSSAWIFAFSPLQWSQATIAEVHALNVAFAIAVFWLLLRWRRQGGYWLPIIAAFLYGLGLGNHLTGLLLVPLLVLWLLLARREDRLTWRNWLRIAGGFLLGLGVYGYLPLAAARHPPINWGNPQTWDRFWWLVTGQLYREAIFGVPWELIPGRLSAWGHLLLQQFGWWGWGLALVGVWRLSRRDRPALIASGYFVAAYSSYGLGYDRADSYVYLLPACLMLAFWLGQGLITSLQAVWGVTQQMSTPRWPVVVPLLAGTLLAAVLPLLPLTSNWAAHDLRQEGDAGEYAAAALAAAAPGALVVTSGDRSTFALWYRRYALEERNDVTIVNGGLWGFDWYRDTLARHDPETALPEEADSPRDLAGLVEASLGRRPVYVTEEARDAVADQVLVPAGPLYLMQAPSAR